MSETDTSVAEESQEMISYYVETSEGMFRVNIPASWSIEIDHTRNGSIIACFSDEKGNDRLMYSGVQVIRDSSAQIQELVASETQPEDGTTTNYEWQDRSTTIPVSRYTADAVQVSARRRRRFQNIAQEESIDYDEGLDVPF